MNKLIVANWKMNPQTTREAVRLAHAEDKTNVVIAPPFPFLLSVGGALKRAQLGAQDVFYESHGAFTGEISPSMLRSLGARYVVVGHSERRARGETEQMVSKKVKAVLAEGIAVVLCVGEPWGVRKKGLAAAKRFVARQLHSALRGISSSVVRHQSFVIAYEPIWAIGTGKADKPAEAVGMTKFIKKLLVASHKLKIKVLYGGSVTPRNAAGFLREPSIDGALVGGASVKAADFRRIIEIAKS